MRQGWERLVDQTLDLVTRARRVMEARAESAMREETKPHRSKAKPATLGAGYRLGGGDIGADGKKTGL